MKEISIEEKAQRYDEALEIAKNNYNVAQDLCNGSQIGVECFKNTLTNIFPELVESGDERIRKELIEIVEEIRSTTYYGRCCYKEIPFKSILAWLEKQGEHANFRNKIQVGDKVTRNENGVLVNLSQLNRVAKPTEEYNITGIKSKNAQGKLGEMIKNLKPVNEVLEQKPTWSEEDEKQARQIERIVHDDGCTQKLQKQIADWLKSLKDRYTWKPSEEQIKTCKEVYADILSAKGFDLGTVNNELNRLEEQLKKL